MRSHDVFISEPCVVLRSLVDLEVHHTARFAPRQGEDVSIFDPMCLQSSCISAEYLLILMQLLDMRSSSLMETAQFRAGGASSAPTILRLN